MWLVRPKIINNRQKMIGFSMGVPGMTVNMTPAVINLGNVPAVI